jgi:Arc/MetJ family transcription regulator
MRTNIEIDDDLMRAAMQATGVTTKKGAVEAALRRLVEIRADEAARKEAVRRGRSKNGQSTDEDWLDRWLASGWK